MKSKLTAQDIQYLKGIRLNPLADYVLQTKPNRKRKFKTIGQTTLADDFRLSRWGLTDDSPISFTDDYGNLNHSKVMDGAAIRDLLLSMPATTQSLFIWILFSLRYRVDIVQIKYEDVISKGLLIGKTSFKNAIEGLEENKIIKRVGPKKRTNDYWLYFINPQIIWKGDAKNFYKDVLKYHPEYLANVPPTVPTKSQTHKPRSKTR